MAGVLLAHGEGIQPGVVADARLTDMAPTILHLLGQSVPDDVDGQVISGLLAPGELDKNPVTTRHVEPDDSGSQDGLTEAEQEEIRGKLEGLGYL